jgi:hypothetical protein
VANSADAAEFVLFQRHYTGFTPHQNLEWANVRETSAVQFSGKSAKELQFVQNLHETLKGYPQ